MLNLQRIIALVANLGQATSRRDNNSRANSSTEDATAQEEGKEEDSEQSISHSIDDRNESENDGDSDSIQFSELNHRLRLWFPFVIILFVHILIAESAKINFIVILAVVIRKLEGTLHETLSGKSSVSSLPFFALLGVCMSCIPIIVISFYFVDQVVDSSRLNHETKRKFSIASYCMFQTQMHMIDEQNPLTIYDAMWYSIAPDLILQLVLIFVKTAYWVFQFEHFLSFNRLCHLLNFGLNYNRSNNTHTGDEADVDVGTPANLSVDTEPLLDPNTSNFKTPLPSSASQTRLSRRSNRIGTSSSSSSSAPLSSNQSQAVLSVSAPSSSMVRKKRVVNLIESVLYLYRYLLPTTVWVLYFSSGYGAEIFVFTYVFVKVSSLGVQLKSIYELMTAIFQGKLEHGQYATTEEASASGNECYICFEYYRNPIILRECQHVFCQHCIEEWLDKENTCPVCRQTVKSTLKNYHLMKGELNSPFPVCI